MRDSSGKGVAPETFFEVAISGLEGMVSTDF